MEVQPVREGCNDGRRPEKAERVRKGHQKENQRQTERYPCITSAIGFSPMPTMSRATKWTRGEEVPKDESAPQPQVRQLHTSPHASTQLAS